MKKLLKFTLEMAENGVLFREGDKTFVFNSPIDLGAQLFEMVSLAPEAPPATYNLFILSPPADRMITAIKIVRMITGDGLKESKDIVDSARADGKCLVKGSLDEAEVQIAKSWLDGTSSKFFVFEECES